MITKSEKIDVDARFLLANERTLLAWVRTSIGIEAGGVVLTQIQQFHSAVGTVVLLLGAAVALMGYHRYWVADHAIRNGELPPVGIGPAIQVAGVVVVALMLSVAQYTILK